MLKRRIILVAITKRLLARRRHHLIDHYLIFIFKRSLLIENSKRKRRNFFSEATLFLFVLSYWYLSRVYRDALHCVHANCYRGTDSILIHLFVSSLAQSVQYHEAICNALNAIFRVVHARGHVATGRVGNNDPPRTSAPQCRGKDSIITSWRYFRRPDSWSRISPSFCRNFSGDVLIWISRWKCKKRNYGKRQYCGCINFRLLKSSAGSDNWRRKKIKIYILHHI